MPRGQDSHVLKGSRVGIRTALLYQLVPLGTVLPHGQVVKSVNLSPASPLYEGPLVLDAATS